MNAPAADKAPSPLEQTQQLGRKLGLYIFFPCIVVSVIGVLVGLANLEGDGPAFLIGSVIALAVSILLFRAAQRGSGRVFMASGAAIILICAAFAVYLVWAAITDELGALRGLVFAAVGGLFGFALMESGLKVLRAEAAEREREMERNPFAELGSSPQREGGRVV